MLAEMGVTLRSTGENGAREYELLAPLVPDMDPARAFIFVGRRTLPPDLATSVIVKHAPSDHDNYEELREQLLDEALEVASTIHPNLTGVADCIENDDGMYLVLEHVDGINLAEAVKTLLDRSQAFSFELVAFLCTEVLKAMQHLHTARDPNGKQLLLVVRDVTPSNVLLSPSGRVRLANRSLAAALEKKRRRSAAQLFAYFAPECIAGEPFSIASDLYGVGVMLWELLVGRQCFAGEKKNDVLNAILKRGVPVQDLHLVKTPSRLTAIVERATAFVPERRFQSAIEMARALETFLRETAMHTEMASLFAHFLVSSKLITPLTTRENSGPILIAGTGSAADMVRLLPARATSAAAMSAEPDLAFAEPIEATEDVVSAPAVEKRASSVSPSHGTFDLGGLVMRTATPPAPLIAMAATAPPPNAPPPNAPPPNTPPPNTPPPNASPRNATPPGATAPLEAAPSQTSQTSQPSLPAQPAPSSSQSLSDRDRRSIAVRTVRSAQKPSMPPAAFSENRIELESFEGEAPRDVKNRTLVLFLALSIAILALILMFIERQEFELDEMDKANDSHAADLREPYSPHK